MSRFANAAMMGFYLFLAGVVLVANIPANGTGAEPEPAAEKANTGPDAAADIPNTKVATILGRDIFSQDIDPPPKWFEDREKYMKLHGKKMGSETSDTYRMNRLREAIWKPISEKYIPKKDLEPTEEELQEYIVHFRQGKARRLQEQQEHLEQLRREADKLEKQLPTQDSEDQEETSQRLQKMRKEIGAIEKSFEIDRRIEGRGKDFEQFSAKWWVGHWKQQQWYYKRYGGRVIYQQVGPEAIDAMRDFLKEAEAKKDFVIYDQKLNAKFWAPYTKERPGVLVRDPDKVFEHPWSIMDRSVNKKERPIAAAAKGRPPVRPKKIVEDVERGTSADALPVEISLEDNAHAEVTIMLRRGKTLRKTLPGTMQLDLTAVGDGQHHLLFHCPGYASQWAYIEIVDGKTARNKIKITLFRKRYVILRCAFNTQGGRNLDGDEVEEQRIALSHWAAPKYFSQDWQIWQGSSRRGELFGDTPYLDFHRISTGFGFAKPAEGVSYEEMKEAPEGKYRCKRRIAKKGLVLYCRVNGNRAGCLGYGKVLVEDVKETPPEDVRVVEVRE